MNLFGKIALLVAFLCLVCLPVASQDSIPVNPAKTKKYVLTPVRASMYAAALPGLGQIYNRKYWKLPFVYGGFGALGYAVTFNSKNYNKFIVGYQDFTDLSPATDSYIELVPYYTPSEYDPVLYPLDYSPSKQAYVRDYLRDGAEYYRKYKELSYIGIVAWYLVTIIDANVDASLFDYDIGDDLNASVAPVVFSHQGISPGVSVAIVFNF